MLLAAETLLVLAGLASLGFGIYAILRGGRDRRSGRGGIGPIPERAIHVLAGARMLLIGALCLAAAAFALSIHLG